MPGHSRQSSRPTLLKPKLEVQLLKVCVAHSYPGPFSALGTIAEPEPHRPGAGCCCASVSRFFGLWRVLFPPCLVRPDSAHDGSPGPGRPKQSQFTAGENTLCATRPSDGQSGMEGEGSTRCAAAARRTRSAGVVAVGAFLAAVGACAACLAVWRHDARPQTALLPENWPRSLPGAEGGGTSWITGRTHHRPERLQHLLVAHRPARDAAQLSDRAELLRSEDRASC